jgi:hypothetical protein
MSHVIIMNRSAGIQLQREYTALGSSNKESPQTKENVDTKTCDNSHSSSRPVPVHLVSSATTSEDLKSNKREYDAPWLSKLTQFKIHPSRC